MTLNFKIPTLASMNNITHIVKRDGRIVPFDQEKITDGIYRAAASVGGHERALSEKLSDEVTRVIFECFQPPDMPIVSEIKDIVEKVLIEEGHAKTAKAMIVYREYRRRERRLKDVKYSQQSLLPYRMMWETLIWNLDHGCVTIGNLNKKVHDGSLAELVSESEKAFNESIRRLAYEIASEKERIKLVIVAGPSSSGKTTTTAKLAKRLGEMGINTVPLNLDHYFFDIDLHPKDEFGDYDFETPEALDITLINEHLKDLVEGKTIKIPHYDFKNGKRHDNITAVSIGPEQVILIDTLHGLYEPMTTSVADEKKFKVYIETISQLRDNEGHFVRWTDIRLLRRMIRDNMKRGYDPMRTLGHWHYVRRSELKHIIPFIRDVDYFLNGALPYELPFIKKYAYHYFPNFIDTLKDIPKKGDAYIRAERIYKLLSQIDQYDDDSIIPGDSLLREFIGGSVYDLH